MEEIVLTSAKVVGLKQSKRAVSEKRAAKALVAEDADDYVVGPFLALCETMGVPVRRDVTMRSLGKACQIDVPTAVVVLLK